MLVSRGRFRNRVSSSDRCVLLRASPRMMSLTFADSTEEDSELPGRMQGTSGSIAVVHQAAAKELLLEDVRLGTFVYSWCCAGGPSGRPWAPARERDENGECRTHNTRAHAHTRTHTQMVSTSLGASPAPSPAAWVSMRAPSWLLSRPSALCIGWLCDCGVGAYVAFDNAFGDVLH